MAFPWANLLGASAAVLVILVLMKLVRSLSYFSDRGMVHVKMNWLEMITSFSMKSFLYQPMEIYRRSEDMDSPYVGYHMNPFKPAILIRDPTLVRDVLIKDFPYFQDHGLNIDVESNPLSGNLFNMDGDEWKTLRHKLVPVFTSGKLKGMVPIMEECADKLIEEMRNNPSLMKDTNLKELSKKFSLSVIANCIFGITPESVSDPNCQFQQILQDMAKPKLSSMLKFASLLFFPKLTKWLKLKIFPQRAEDFMLALTRDTMELRKKSGVKRNDFIQLLLELKEKGSVELDSRELEQDETEALNNMSAQPPNTKMEFTYELLTAQAFVFLVGGFENVAYMIAISEYLLSKNPEVQERVRQEVEKCRDRHGKLDYLALRDMKLLGACIDESLRLYSPTFSVMRVSNKPYYLSDGVVIEKGLPVIIPGISLQQDPKYWTDPEKFRPERFLDEAVHPGTYLPFGDGPRICIAQRMALLMVKVVLAKLVLTFSLVPSPRTREPIHIETFIGAFDNRGGFWGSFQPIK